MLLALSLELSINVIKKINRSTALIVIVDVCGFNWRILRLLRCQLFPFYLLALFAARFKFFFGIFFPVLTESSERMK